MAVLTEQLTRGDFVVLHLMQYLTATPSTQTPAIAKNFDAVGDALEKEFVIDETPVGPGYLVLQFYDLNPSKHRVLINGKSLSLDDLPESTFTKNWYSWTEVIPVGFLVKGPNKLRIECKGKQESFLVRDAIIHWHEPTT